MRRFSGNVRALQWIDRHAGVPVCFLLTGIRRISTLFARQSGRAATRSVLFLKLAEQGSTVLAHEAIRTAVARVGRQNVYFLVFEENRFIVDLLGLIPPENVLTVRTRSAWTMLLSCGRCLRMLRRRRIDACVDMEFFARFSAAIGFLTGARQRVGFHSYFGEGPYRGDLLTHRVLYNPHLHTSQVFTSLVLALEVDARRLPALAIVPPPNPPLPIFQPAAAEQAEVRKLIDRVGVTADLRLILLNANSGDLLPLRKWYEANYVVLARRLLTEFSNVAIAFTGSPEEAARIEELVRRVDSPRCVCLAGKTTLRQLMVVYGLAEVLVTNDSGPAHFGALTGIDVVALFGPETPLLFAAQGPRSHPVWAGIVCSPCINALNNRQTACRDNQCMKSIPVDRVFELVCDIYRTRTKSAR